jgi:spore coat polysaccharide biosynthesis protein SpsF
MGSTRLPGKVLAPLAGRPTLERVVERVARTPGLNGVAILTSEALSDEPIRALAQRLGVASFAGSEQDLVDRFHRAAQELGADLVLRVTADCPLIDPEVLGKLLEFYHADRPDHAAVATGTFRARPNLKRYPDGLDGELFSREILELAWREATDPFDREHVTPFLWRQPERFSLALLEAPEDFGAERWTLDYPADLRFIQAVYERLDGSQSVGVAEVIELLEREPELRAINAAERAMSLPVR